LVLVAAAVLTGQLSIGWLNDALDVRRDIEVGRTDKPVVAGEVSVPTLRTAAAVAALACVPLSLASGAAAGAVHLVAVAAGWAYDAGVKSTAASVVPYLVCFGLLPVFVVLGLPGSPAPPWWLPVGGALLGAGAHFANVLPDLDDDAATGVRAAAPVRGLRLPGGRGAAPAGSDGRARRGRARSPGPGRGGAGGGGRRARRRLPGRTAAGVARPVPGGADRCGGGGGTAPRRGTRGRRLTIGDGTGQAPRT
jgi:UbiA prenyltransferase family